MDDYISRQVAIDAMGCISDSLCEGQATDALCELPSADVVEVVRCKDCLIHGLCRFEQGLGLDGFCSKGERKDG